MPSTDNKGENEVLRPGKNSAIIYDARLQKWLHFHHPLKICLAHKLESVVDVFHAAEQQASVERLYAAGFLAYEAGPAFDPALVVHHPGDFPLLWLGLYRRPEVLTFPPPQRGNPAPIPWQPSVSEQEYQRSFQRIKEYIGAGDTYQVNYTFRLRAPFAGDPWELFARMIHAQGFGYGAFVNAGEWTVCSASPELFFTWEKGVLTSLPMKGTAARGLTQAADLRQAGWLARSRKNRAENVMIVDMVRNDMGRIADRASVEVTSLYDVEKYPTLWQLTSTVRCRTQAGLTDIFRALFPAASITGAPKVRTMQIIREIESTPRRIYTGTVGFIAPDARAQFNVAIRTVLVDKQNGTAEYGLGGGIVWDSGRAGELQECYTKARILTQAPPCFSLLETILWSPGDGYFLLDRHLNRLAASAAYFSRTVDLAALQRQLEALAGKLRRYSRRIRLLIPPEEEPALEVQRLSPLLQPYEVGIAKKPVDSRDPFLYHKTTHRGTYEQAMAEAPGHADVLLWNERNEVTESCIANIVVEKDGQLLTPPTDCGLLPGTYRSYLLDQGRVREEIVMLSDLPSCTRIYLANSVRGLWEVNLDINGHWES